MRYVYFPDELAGYNPTWINGEFLEKAVLENGELKVGDARYKALYVDVDYLGYRVLRRLAEIAKSGFPVVLKRMPEEPGAIAHRDYAKWAGKLKRSKNVSGHLPEGLSPFLTGEKIPRHWCRQNGDVLYIFFPNPKADRLKFPLEYGQSFNTETLAYPITVHFQGSKIDLNLVFEPYQSLLYKIENSKAEQVDIEFVPGTPVVKPRPADFKAPWLVE